MSVVLRTRTTAYNVITAASTAVGDTDDAVDIAVMVYYIVAVGHSSAVRCYPVFYYAAARRDQYPFICGSHEYQTVNIGHNMYSFCL